MFRFGLNSYESGGELPVTGGMQTEIGQTSLHQGGHLEDLYK